MTVLAMRGIEGKINHRRQQIKKKIGGCPYFYFIAVVKKPSDIRLAYRLAGAATFDFALTQFILSIYFWLWLDACCFDPVSILLLCLGRMVRHGSRKAIFAAIPVTVLYLLAFVVPLLSQEQSWGEIEFDAETVSWMVYFFIVLFWNMFNLIALIVAIRKSPTSARPTLL